MKTSLFFKALIRVIFGFALLAAIIFVPAGTLDYIGAWRLLLALFVPMLIFGTVLLIKSPERLEKRLRMDESRQKQTLAVTLSSLMFVVGFVLAGLDRRFGWSDFPDWLSVTATVILLLSYILYAEVIRENAFLSRTVEIQEGQTVVDTGLYSVVRHPMYSATLLLFMSTPLVLGSYYSFIVFLIYPLIIRGRIIDEEKLLEEELSGYSEYKTRVKYRLLPFIW